MVIQLAGCIIVDDYDRILLLHRATDQFQHWELPGGKVEKNETAADAAVRELAEELGLTVRLLKPVGSEAFQDDNGEFNFVWFLAEIVAGQPMVMEPTIFDDYDYIDLEDLPSLSLSANMQVLEEKLVSGEVALQ